MHFQKLIIVLGVISTLSVLAVSSCSEDSDCSSLSGSVCSDGDCVCPNGQQQVLGGTVCADLAPYHMSTCVESHQCSRMFTSFECRRHQENSETGTCRCQPGFHFFLGRCWSTSDYGTACTRDEECLSVLRNPFSLSCDGTCACADGFYERQRGECREIGYAVGDGCVLDEDCQFPGGACNIATFLCYNSNDPETQILSKNTTMASLSPKTTGRQNFAPCSVTAPCASPFECSEFGVCLCPVGYFSNDNGDLCLAELGSPVTSEEQCTGLFAVVRDGICTCMANFFFEENMRDCIRATRRITDSCVTDSNCFTFGAASRCGDPQPPWGFRNCECILEEAVWDADRDMCRLVVGIGEACEVDSDCLAGGLEIDCVVDEDGQGMCTCPEGYLEQDGLCLTTGLELGDACQVTAECTGTENTVCEDGHCSCDSEVYQEVNEVCVPSDEVEETTESAETPSETTETPETPETPPVLPVWYCSEDSDCSSLSGSVCSDGDCVCPTGQQQVLGGTVCAYLAPYHTSTCVESHQCSRMFTSFECRRNQENSETGTCRCQPGFHFFLGRCWRTYDYGTACTRDEECFSVLRNPFSLSCDGTCGCADGFYERQRGECREIGFAVGDGCVLDEDCQFPGGACNIATFLCYNSNNPGTQILSKNLTMASLSPKTAARQHFAACSLTEPCASPFECSGFGVCLCPVGYFSNDNGDLCLAELGSPVSSEAQCTGLFAEVRNGICTCMANFFFDENMRDCIKASRTITDSCVTDSNCFTFGAASRCGEPQPPWGFRNCECILEEAVWDANRDMCRLFAGIGEACEVDSDCLAGALEIHCVVDDGGQGTCTCPDGYFELDGLCLTTGLELGDACQATAECTETENTVCEDGRCSCDSNGYQEVDGACAPIIGGVCAENADCVIENTVCVGDDEGVLTCQCGGLFVEAEDVCWPVVTDIGAACNVTAQCEEVLGETGACVDGHCACIENHHYRDEGCWPMTDLFEGCTRSSQCYLSELTDRVVCRNSLCQCDFDYPFSEELHTCTDSSSTIVSSAFVITTSLLYLFIS